MNTYKTAVDLRRALDARLKNEAEERGTDYMRLRRIVVFDRIAARLSVSHLGWVLKGGTALEFRLGLRARATKDLDLVLRAGSLSGAALRDALIEALATDIDRDWFVFQVSHLPGTLEFAGKRPRSIESADRRQHFAEKLHALTRDYGSRPNTRVKDLVDLLLLIHDGLPPDRRLLAVAEHVFGARAMHPMPTGIPDPPPAWQTEYPALAGQAVLPEQDLPAALDTLRAFWARAISTGATT